MNYVAATRSSPPDTSTTISRSSGERISVAGHTRIVREIIPGVGHDGLYRKKC